MLARESAIRIVAVGIGVVCVVLPSLVVMLLFLGVPLPNFWGVARATIQFALIALGAVSFSLLLLPEIAVRIDDKYDRQEARLAVTQALLAAAREEQAEQRLRLGASRTELGEAQRRAAAGDRLESAVRLRYAAAFEDGEAEDAEAMVHEMGLWIVTARPKVDAPAAPRLLSQEEVEAFLGTVRYGDDGLPQRWGRRLVQRLNAEGAGIAFPSPPPAGEIGGDSLPSVLEESSGSEEELGSGSLSGSPLLGEAVRA